MFLKKKETKSNVPFSCYKKITWSMTCDLLSPMCCMIWQLFETPLTVPQLGSFTQVQHHGLPKKKSALIIKIPGCEFFSGMPKNLQVIPKCFWGWLENKWGAKALHYFFGTEKEIYFCRPLSCNTSPLGKA